MSESLEDFGKHKELWESGNIMRNCWRIVEEYRGLWETTEDYRKEVPLWGITKRSWERT